MSDEARAALAQLSELWRRERDAAREAFRQERKLLDFRAVIIPNLFNLLAQLVSAPGCIALLPSRPLLSFA